MLKDIKYTGINTASNAYDAKAGQLAVAHNVVNERGYIEALAPPVEEIAYTAGNGLSGYGCVFRHEMLSGAVNCIFYKPADDESSDDSDSVADEPVGSLRFLTMPYEEGDVASEITWGEGLGGAELYDITAVGNTLCVLTSLGMDYIVWDGGDYKELGTDLPFVNLVFGLELKENYASGQVRTLFNESTPTQELLEMIDDDFKAFVSTVTHEVRRNGEFVYPFLVRYALRLYDGTLTRHSAPVLMTVHDMCAPFLTIQRTFLGPDMTYDYFSQQGVISAVLAMKIGSWIPEEWRDVVTGVEIYASAPFSRYMEDGRPSGLELLLWTQVGPDEYIWSDQQNLGGECTGAKGGDHKVYQLRDVATQAREKHITAQSGWWVEYPTREVDVLTAGLFYRIAEFKADYADGIDTSEWQYPEVGDLNNLVVRTLMADDYYSSERIIPKGVYMYNQRLNLFNMTADSIVPFSHDTYLQYLTPTTSGNESYLMVKARDEDGVDRWIGSIVQDLNPSEIFANMRYLFIPVRNAVEAKFYWRQPGGFGQIGGSVTLELHQTLNGSVWFNDFARYVNVANMEWQPFRTTMTRYIANKIYTSEVGNPYYFPVGGINTVGTGKILALASNVRAISQGQFGEFPLYVFTESGIWMLEVDDKGLYKAKQPMSLDVIEPASRVTSVDNAVAYVIKRGLMLVSGSETRCISEVLDGAYDRALPTTLGGFLPSVTWDVYKKGVACAYDSVSQRLHVYNPDYTYHYVYSVRTGLWSTEDNYTSGGVAYKMLSTLSGNYVNTAHGLLNMSRGNTSAPGRTQTVLTRPINFDTDAYKRMRDNIQRGDIDLLRVGDTRNISVLVQATDDLLNWHDIAAVTRHYRIVRKSGTPHKWFRWKIVIESSPEEYRLHGLTADVEVVGNNKLR